MGFNQAFKGLIRCVCRKVPGSNFGPKNGNPDFIIFRFSAVPSSSDSHSQLKIGNNEAQTFPKSRINLKIRVARMVTSSQFSTEDPQISDAKVQNLVARYLCSPERLPLTIAPFKFNYFLSSSRSMLCNPSFVAYKELIYK